MKLLVAILSVVLACAYAIKDDRFSEKKSSWRLALVLRFRINSAKPFDHPLKLKNLQCGALEGQYAKNTNQLVALSEQNLIDCSWDEGNRDFHGGSAHYAFEYVKKNDIVREKDYLYSVNIQTCRADKYPIVTKISSYVQIPEGDEEALVEGIARQGPVSISLDGPAISSYQSGIFSGPCNKTSLNHAVLAVGYGSEDGKEFYIMNNSWDNYWGAAGYFRIARNSDNLCGLSSWSFYPNL